MKIAQVLESKPVQDIYYVSQNQSIEEAAERLSTLRIGSLIVSEDGNKIDGIISERDIVRDLGVAGSQCLRKPVSELMTKEVKTVTSEVDTATAAKIMTMGRFRHLPVVDGGELKGVISIGDVVSARLKEVENENQALSEMIAGSTY